MNTHWFIVNIDGLLNYAAGFLWWNDIIGGIGFFCSRIVYGTYLSYVFWQEAFQAFRESTLPPFLEYSMGFLLLINIALNALNYFWFFAILNAVLTGKREAKVKNL